jgi:hypothetical protein
LKSIKKEIVVTKKISIPINTSRPIKNKAAILKIKQFVPFTIRAIALENFDPPLSIAITFKRPEKTIAVPELMYQINSGLNLVKNAKLI